MRNGVPQGSVLGPLLFIIYVNGLQDGMKFADDTKMAGVVNNEVDRHNLQERLEILVRWSSSRFVTSLRTKEYLKTPPSALLFKGAPPRLCYLKDPLLSRHVCTNQEACRDVETYSKKPKGRWQIK